MPTILVAGATGLVGSALVEALRRRGDEVRRLVRGDSRFALDFPWDPAEGQIPDEALSGAVAVVNLCGAGIADARWTAERRRLLRSSRVDPARLIADACIRNGVGTLVNASATGFYGDRGEEILDERSPSGGGFLADTCVAWEHALRSAEEAGVRVAKARLGVVLAPRGGALEAMLPAFKMGVGGPLGTGAQWFSWIHLDDAVAGFLHLLDHPSARGPHLLVAPGEVRQKSFATALGKALRRPAILPVPGFVLRCLLGGMAKELLLGSQRCHPVALAQEGFSWKHPTLETALADVVQRRKVMPQH
jgi:uncharacterized protein (TIGR01777 family)